MFHLEYTPLPRYLAFSYTNRTNTSRFPRVLHEYEGIHRSLPPPPSLPVYLQSKTHDVEPKIRRKRDRANSISDVDPRKYGSPTRKLGSLRRAGGFLLNRPEAEIEARKLSLGCKHDNGGLPFSFFPHLVQGRPAPFLPLCHFPFHSVQRLAIVVPVYCVPFTGVPRRMSARSSGLSRKCHASFLSGAVMTQGQTNHLLPSPPPYSRCFLVFVFFFLTLDGRVYTPERLPSLAIFLRSISSTSSWSRSRWRTWPAR